MAEQKIKYGTQVTLAITALNSLANSATAGWKSVRTSNTTTLAVDYEIFVKLTMANTAPANDKCVYVYACPWYYDGTTWYANDGGTTTLPTDSDAAYTIASPNDLILLGVMNYTTQQMVMQKSFSLANAFGNQIPDGFSIIIVDYSGAAISGSGNVVAITPITYTIA